MTAALRRLLWVACLCGLVGRAVGQETARTVEVSMRVTAVAGRDVFLDAGRAEGLRPDDRVTLRIAGEGPVDVTVLEVSKHHARARLPLGVDGILEGATGVVRIPADRLAPPPPPVATPTEEGGLQAAPTRAPPPDHPAWTQPPETWTAETPLLAPAVGRTEADRERSVDGRAWIQWTGNLDRTVGDRQASVGRIGTWFDVTNPFGQGGGLRIAAQANRFDATLPDGPDDQDSDLWFDRLSYSRGGTEAHPDRWEVGRFLQKEYPELQLLDGGEYNHRTSWGDRVGVSAGFMPEPFPGLPSGDDFQVAAYYRALIGADDELALGGAYQNTWHEGEQDRNLFLASLDWNPTRRMWLRSVAWVDVYGAEDDLKSEGPELTELQVQGGHRFGRAGGVGLSFRHRRWPQLKRTEFLPSSAAEIADSRVDQLWLNGWWRALESLRLRARVGTWEDQERSGANGEVGATLDDLWRGGQLDGAVFMTEGAFATARPGLRLTASQRLDDASLSLAWGIADWEQEDFVGGQASLVQQSLRAAVDWSFLESWNLSVSGERLFGDELDAWILGFYLQRRF